MRITGSNNTEVPVEELELILKAFTKDELLVEAQGWQKLLRAKAVEIGAAEIAVKRQNREIGKAREIQEQAREAEDQLEEVQDTADEAKATGDAQKIQQTEQAAREARETIDEISVAPLLAVVGAAGFVIAFALQDSLSNFASGIMILFFRPFDVGDVVDAGGVSGNVKKMNLVSTTIKTFDNKDMVVPNNKIWQDVIVNSTGVRTRRVDMEFGIGYDDDIDQAQAILEEIVGGHPKVLKKPEPTIRVNTLADSSVNFICRPWTRTADYWDVYWEVTKAVKQRFDADGIGIPFPQRDVHLYLEGGAIKEAVAAAAKGEGAPDGSNR